MLYSDDSDSPGRERSLLSLGDALREEPAAEPSRLARAIAEVRAEKDAVTRHRLARARRNARDTPLLHALEAVPAEPSPSGPFPVKAEPSLLKPDPPRAAPESAPAAPVPAPAVSSWRDAQPKHDAEPKRATAAEKPAGGGEPVARPTVQQMPAAADPARAEAVAQRREPSEPAWQAVEPLAPAEAAEAAGLWQPLIDPAIVLAGIMRSKWLIVATTVIGALLGVLIALNTPKMYYSSAELLADPRDLNLVERELTQSGISNEATLAIVENQVRILTSGTVIAKVVERLNLAEDPEFNGQGGGVSLGSLISSARSLIFPRDGEDDPGRRHALASINLAKSLSIERRGKTFVIVVAATTQSPEKSALIANTMTEVFLESYGQLQSNAAGRAAGELTSKLDELRAGVEAAERKVEAFKAENDLIDAQGRLITDDEILKLNDQLSTARARTLELNARAASTRDVNADAVLGGALPEELASPTLQELRAQYSALKGEADRMAVRLGPRHPQLQAVESQLSGARGLIDAEIRRISTSTQTELRRAVQLEQELSARLAQLKVRQGSLSNELVTLRELERDSTAKRAVYEAFLLRARETGEQQGINSANISVISKAFPPLESEPPSRSTIAMAGALLGLMAGVGMGGLRGTAEALRDRVRGRRPARSWRRGSTATMFDQDDGGLADDGRNASASAPEPVSADRPPSEPFAEADQTEPSPVSPKDTAMHPYPMPHAPYDPAQQPAPAAVPYAAQPAWPQPPAGYAPPPYPPQHYAPQPGYAQPYYAQPMPAQQPAAMPYAAQPAWPQPPAGYAPPYPPQHYAPQPGYAQPYYAQPMPGQQPQAPQQPQAAHPQAPVDAQSSIDEIRSSLREFREAIRELADSRSRRRYF
jgi:succinoglycan biosynthesis transport protein ExoP